jgi:isoquinoline 1-oxidoreductase subunit beta
MEGYGTSMAQVAEVSVQGETVRVHRVVVAADLGKMVNPNIVRQQLEGSIIYGLSAVLYGEITLQKGRVQQSNFHDYQVMRMPESPTIEMHLVDSDEKPAGIGEPGDRADRPRGGERGVRGHEKAFAQAAAPSGLAIWGGC